MRKVVLLFTLTLVGLAFALPSGSSAGSAPAHGCPFDEPCQQGAPTIPQTRCEDSDSARCLENLRTEILEEVAAKDPTLSWPLVQLVEADREAIARGKGITGTDVSSLPKSLIDLTAAGLMHIDGSGRVQVFIHIRGVAGEVGPTLQQVGGRVDRVAEAQKIVQAWVPIGQIKSLARAAAIERIRLPDYGIRQVGSVTTEGDGLLSAADARSTFGIDGSGVRVGVISDGVEGLAASQASGDLPAVNTTACDVGPGTPTAAGAGAEGTAMLEIVHDLAPGAELWYGFDGANFGGTMLDFMAAVDCLAQNVDVVVDDVAFFNAGPYDGTSPVSLNATAALNAPTNPIRGYYNAVGNSALGHYQEQYVDSAVLDPTFPGFHVFSSTANTGDAFGIGPNIADPFFLFSGEIACIVLQWNDSFSGSSNDYDLYLFDEDLLFIGDPNALVASSINPQTGTQAPVEELCYQNTGPTGYFDIVIFRFDASQSKTFDMFVLCSGCAGLPDGLFTQPIHNYNTPCSSVPNNSDAGGGVVALGAIDAADPGTDDIEFFSSCGPTNDGRIKPNAAAVDGVSVTGNGGFVSSFFGTSAAAPHAAGIAALLLDCDPSLTRTQLRNALLNSAIDLGPPGADNKFGAGRLHGVNAAEAAGCVAQPPNGAMAIDCDGFAPGVQVDCVYASDSTFPVEIHVTAPPIDGYFGFQEKLRWNEGVLNYLPAVDPSSEAQWPECDIPTRVDNQPSDASVVFGCDPLTVLTQGDTFVGAVVRFELQCKAVTSSADLVLVPRLGDSQSGTHFLDGKSLPVDPDLADATVVCIFDGDTDSDGCTDAQELGLSATLGGLRDRLSFWDFFDTPDSNNVRDRAITIGDIGRVVARFGTFGDAAIDPLTQPPASGYHTAFDRTPGGPNVWNVGAPNGAVTIQDIGLMVAQFGHSCA